jgi:phosphate transport system ATP-binding protein
MPTSSTLTVPGAAVVQLVSGDVRSSDAMVVEVQPATLVLSEERLVAGAGDQAWAWMLRDVVDTVHSPTEPWTIITVPGISEFGVAVPTEHLVEFRSMFDRLLLASRQHFADAPLVFAATSADGPSPELAALAGGTSNGVATGGAAAVAAPAVAASKGNGRRRWGRGKASDSQGSETHDVFGNAHRELAGLDAHNISAWFGDHQVLDRVSLNMEAGKVTSLIGPSGCGKSTFLRILNRMHEMIPSASLAGEVLLDGHDIYDPERKLTDARREIGMVFQKPNPFPAMSIYDNTVASLQLTGAKVSASVKDELVETCLTKAGLWKEVKDRLRAPGGGLSGGQQQRLCIARALAIKPRVLLMDEPCSALDPTSTRRIEETIMELASEVTIVIVTHNMQQAARVSDYCAFFLATQGTPGVIVEHGPTEAMFGAPQDERTLDYVTGRFG